MVVDKVGLHWNISTWKVFLRWHQKCDDQMISVWIINTTIAAVCLWTPSVVTPSWQRPSSDGLLFSVFCSAHHTRRGSELLHGWDVQSAVLPWPELQRGAPSLTVLPTWQVSTWNFQLRFCDVSSPHFGETKLASKSFCTIAYYLAVAD